MTSRRVNHASAMSHKTDLEKLMEEHKKTQCLLREVLEKQVKSNDLNLELINLLAPLFPPSTNIYNASTEIEEAAAKDYYADIKLMARRIRATACETNSEIKSLSWKGVEDKFTSLHKQLICNLESKAYLQEGIKLHLCENQWGADRFLFECFRAAAKDQVSSQVESSVTLNAMSSATSPLSPSSFVSEDVIDDTVAPKSNRKKRLIISNSDITDNDDEDIPQHRVSQRRK
ncbi:hypothetical protein BD408DRAFT_407604 [Parasitella parasitica]|nr:hypothetical protein BD408DRAFT_407604 [Parasitella parasitica]